MVSVPQADNGKRGDFNTLYLEAMNAAQNIQKQRGEAYNTSSQVGDYFLYGRESALQMMWVKFLRVKNEIEANTDSTDSLIDLINYTAFTYALIRSDDERPPLLRTGELITRDDQNFQLPGGPLKTGESN